MSSPVQTNATLISLPESVKNWSDTLLVQAPLTEDQREDFTAIQSAAREFINYASAKMALIMDGVDKETAQRIRHDLRNYLNIIVGFSRLMVKELPDNLLFHMVTVRQIHDAGESLMTQVDSIQ